jgi:serine/threonine protein kinase
MPISKIFPDQVVVNSGDFERIEQIGKGGHAVVELWRDKRDPSRLVAAKIFAEVPADGSHRIIHECETLVDLSSQFIVKGLGISLGTSELPNIVLLMEYLTGGSLAAPLTPLDPTAKNKAIICVLKALLFLHGLEAPLAHGDLKPSNVLLDGKGGAKLADFGSAIQVDADLTQTRISLTPAYAAPEALNGEIRLESDIWGSA